MVFRKIGVKTALEKVKPEGEVDLATPFPDPDKRVSDLHNRYLYRGI